MNFTGIDKKKMLEYMDNKLLLSYSSLDKYYRCPFSYYLDKVLKINVYEETFYQVIGTLFHAILQKYFDGKDSFEELWIQGKKEIGREFTAKEEFFLEKLRDELEFVIETIEYQETLKTGDKDKIIIILQRISKNLHKIACTYAILTP